MELWLQWQLGWDQNPKSAIRNLPVEQLPGVRGIIMGFLGCGIAGFSSGQFRLSHSLGILSSEFHLQDSMCCLWRCSLCS